MESRALKAGSKESTALQSTSGQQGEQKSIWEPSGYDDDTEKM